MATPSPSPDPAVELVPQPATPAAILDVPTGPACRACGGQAVVIWRRRPTDDELAEQAAAEQARREQTLLLADPQLPAPEFPPLPATDDTTLTMYACADHAITLDAATLIHAGTCTAPNDTGMHGCDCTPEPHPEPEPDPDPADSRLPAYWVTGGA